MMRSAEKTSKTLPPTPAPLYLVEAKIVVSLEQHCYLLNDGRVARQALSCLLQPEVGDHVLAAACQDDTPYILHILQRNHLKAAHLSVPGAEQLCIDQQQIALQAGQSIALRAAGDVEVSAATGVLSLNARNLFATVSESLVQNVRHFVGQAEHYLLDVKQLLRLHGQQALVTADQDIKVDAERISLG
jgi:hypothetical protein